MSVDLTNESTEAWLPAVERTVAFIRRRNHLSRDEAEDLAAFVKLKLVEREHSIRTGFRGRSSLETYLSVMVHRLFLDYRDSRWGRWRPSSVAKHLGTDAVRLEDLIFRQGRSPAEAVRELMNTSTTARDEQDLEALARSLPPRHSARSDESALPEPAAPAADDPVIAGEDHAAVVRMEVALGKALAKLPPQDRLIVRLHFFEGLAIASVAQTLSLRQKPMYRRVEGILASLRAQLESDGVDPKTLTSLIGRPEFGVGFRKDFTMSVGKHKDDPSMES